MRLCLYNPHTALFAPGVYHRMFHKPFQAKYGWMLHYVRSGQHDTALVVDGTVSSFPIHYITRWSLVFRLVSFIEIYLWCMLCGLNPFRVTILFSLTRLDPHRDILFGMGFVGPSFEFGDPTKTLMGRYPGPKLLQFSHYFTKTRFLASQINAAGVRVFVAEADVMSSPFFKEFFHFVDTVYVLPFVLRSRYVRTTAFETRINKCLAIGTTHHLAINEYTRDYCEFFKSDNYHRMRRALYEERNQVSDLVDVNIYPWEDKPLPSSRFYHAWKIYQYAYKLFHKEQSSYWKFDIVALYNKYTMFVSPEEDVGLPSINFIEGMACGCVFIGLDHAMYRSLGMQDGIHYIAYDGTLDDLCSRISHYVNRPAELSAIADQGHAFVTRCFDEARVRETFWSDMEKYAASGVLVSSFVHGGKDAAPRREV